jgi:hypothetical protein
LEKESIYIQGAKMKTTILLTILAGFLIATSGAWAVEKSPAQNTILMQELVFGGTIDSKIAFYQKRIYLADSEFKILADIGNDAINTVRFLKSNRQKLVNNMISENINLKNSSQNAFIGSKTRTIGTTMEAYSTE